MTGNEVSDQPTDGTRWMRFLWLVYLGSLLFQPAFNPTAGLFDWAVVVGLIVVFLPLYFASFHPADDRRLLLLVAAMAALGLAGSLLNSGASVFLIYAAAAAAYLAPVKRGVLVIAALVALVGIILIISPTPMPWRLFAHAPAFVFTIVVGAASIFDAERDRAERRLRRADEEIERLATLAERERIARDLHDLLGHTLSVIVVKSELAARLAELEPARAAGEMRDVERIGREALSEVRAAVAGYRAQGLRGEVESARRALDAAGIKTTVESELPALPVAVESALAFALRESVTNVVRHSGAQRTTIRLGIEQSDVVLEVADDGHGGSATEGSGLTGMRERVNALGGSVRRDRASGTRVRVALPYEAISAIRPTASESVRLP